MCNNNNCRGCPEHKTDRIPVASDPLILPYQVINGREMSWRVVNEFMDCFPTSSKCVFVNPDKMKQQYLGLTLIEYSEYPKLREWLISKHIPLIPCVIKF